MEAAESKPRKEEESELKKPPPMWYRAPTIVPNYGSKSKRNSMLPKSKIQHVLLHDNKNQKNILDSKVKYISYDFKRSSRLFDLHKRSFLVRQSMKQVGLWEKGIDHVQILPDMIVQLHCPGNSKETAMQSATARRHSVTKAELQAMFPNFDEGNKSCIKPPHTLRMLQAYQVGGKAKGVSTQSSLASMSDMNKYRVSGDAPDAQVSPSPAQRKASQHMSGVHGLSPTQSFFYNRSKTAMPKMQTELTRKFSTYNFSSRRELTTAGNKSTYARAMDDPRFADLKKQLIAPEKPIDGFIQLSPCGQKVIQKYGSSMYDPSELNQLLDKYNDVSYMSTRKLRSAKKKEERQRQKHHLLPAREAFVSDDDDRNSIYSSAERSSTDSLLLELE